MLVDHGGDLTYATQELKAIEEAESSSVLVPSSNSNNLSDAFENLHVEDGTGLFTIRDSVILQMGAGDFATHEFKRCVTIPGCGQGSVMAFDRLHASMRT